MKGKFRKILGVGLVLALVLSFSLVAAVPAAADSDADAIVFLRTGSSTTTWSTAEKEIGTYSVLLDFDGAGGTYAAVQVTPQSGITIDDIGAITSGWSWWYHVEVSKTYGTILELHFEDPVGTGHIDITVNTAETGAGLVLDTWTKEAVTSASTATCMGDDPAGTVIDTTVFGGETGIKSLAEIETGLNGIKVAYATWELTRVQVQNGWTSTARDAYIDDITIDGTVYELEPIFLDKVAYNVGATVEVTVPNFNANTDPIRVNPITGEPVEGFKPYNWSVTAISDSDPSGITVDLEETGINTGVFTGSFATTDTTPAAEDEVYVEEGDTITVTYGETYAADWGAGDSTTSIDVLVDDTDPTISALSPADGDTISNRTPDIGATYDTVPINSVELIFDGVDVTDDDATTVGTTSVSYTPEDDLADGTYDVTLNIEDDAGNTATETWSFSIASWLDGSPVSSDPTEVSSLDELDTVDLGVAVTITGDEGVITVGRYASNPEPDAPPTFSLIGNGFFDVQVLKAENATQIVIKFADPEITAETIAYVWDDIEGAWLECSDQGYNSVAEYLWVKVRTDTVPNIAELEGTPFAISGVPEEFDPWIYDVNDDDAIQKTEALAAIADYFDLERTKAEALEVIALYFG